MNYEGKQCLTGSHGSLDDQSRSSSWTLLKHLRGSDDVSWLIGGDFNEILHHREKVGGRAKSDHVLLDFHLAVDECGLIDIGFDGDIFTCVNRREAGETIFERLNRCFCNSTWRALFPHASVTHLDFFLSDHRAIEIQLGACLVPAKRYVNNILHFEEAWLSHPECRSVILRGWHSVLVDGTTSFLALKTKHCMTALHQ